MKTIHRTILLAAFAMWFGGFGFYVSIVVPIGTDVLGSAIEQSVITRQVTVWINVFNAIVLVPMLIESVVTWNRSGAVRRWLQLVMVVIIAGGLVVLLIVHPILDAMFDEANVAVSDSGRFYNMHRIYLWTSTVQWIAAWAWLPLVVFGWQRNPGWAGSEAAPVG